MCKVQVKKLKVIIALAIIKCIKVSCMIRKKRLRYKKSKTNCLVVDLYDFRM